MANANRPRGFSPVRYLNGSPWNGAMNIYYHSTANASAVYKGSLVETDVGLASPSTDPLGTYQCIIPCADDAPNVLGVAWAFGTTPNVLTQVNNLGAVDYCPASTGMYIAIIDDPNVIFLVQDNGTTLTAGQIGLNFDTSSNAAGSSATGRSSGVLDQATLTAASAQCRIMRLAPRPDNTLGANADWEVLINEHVYKDAEPKTT